MIMSWIGRVAAVASLGFLVFTPISLADEPAGVLWETTSQTVMEGMPMQMPVQKMRICSPRVWTRPPAGGDQSCKTSNFRVVGPKASWTIECTGEMQMSGVGEMTFSGTDSYSGFVKLTAEMMSMTVNLSGRKIGACDNPQ